MLCVLMGSVIFVGFIYYVFFSDYYDPPSQKKTEKQWETFDRVAAEILDACEPGEDREKWERWLSEDRREKFPELYHPDEYNPDWIDPDA